MMGMRWAMLMAQQIKDGKLLQPMAPAQAAQAAHGGGILDAIRRRRKGNGAAGNAGKTLMGGSNG